MLRSIIGMGLAMAAAATTGASDARSMAPAFDQAGLIALEQSWMEAMQKRDAATLDRVLGPEFQLAGAGLFEQPPVPRAVWIDNALHRLTVRSVHFDKTRVRVFGDAATVESVFSWSGDFGGEAFTDTTVLVDTWIRRPGGWQVVYRLVQDNPPAK